ncbi:hypothetical protein V6N13_101321 [Hibiscus sabdariffa]|uniref:DUF7086 domain-containing protein n=1 Tax=Hibiscus sabdariffa TaxID=183260 RepID=A0ABR2QL02_9ROSI
MTEEQETNKEMEYNQQQGGGGGEGEGEVDNLEEDNDEGDDDILVLRLSSSSTTLPVLEQDPDPVQEQPYVRRSVSAASGGGGRGGGGRPSRNSSVRRNSRNGRREGRRSETIEALYPWATKYRATVHSLEYLLSKGICTITGVVQCKRCERQFEIGYDLREKFKEVATYIARNKSSMHDRAPGVWLNPVLPKCKFCHQENIAKPVIAQRKKHIDWLFLLLGQLLGCCTLSQLKYFCKHTKNHCTGAKDRVLYLTYLCLCKQLDPSGPFDRES